MDQYHHLQIRFPASDVSHGMEFTFQGGKYTLGKSVPKTLQPERLPMGVLVGGYTEQFQLLQDGRPMGEAWFYFYHAFEDKDWAVLDEAELAPSARAC